MGIFFKFKLTIIQKSSMEKPTLADTTEYIEFEQKHNRFINMLAESDRNLRKQALLEFRKTCNNSKNEKILEYFYRNRLCKRVVICLEDQVEKNRELSIEIITIMIEKVGF